MNYEEIKETFRKEREAFNSLPTAEQMKRRREGGVRALLNMGYITPDEADRYRRELTALPQDRKGLVVAYFFKLLEIDLDRETPTMEMTEQIDRLIASYNFRERGAYQNGKTIRDVLTEEEWTQLKEKIALIPIRQTIKRVETFVDSKRRRIRSKVRAFLLLEIALSLSETKPKGDIDNIPNLRRTLQENGYKGKGKSLNEEDKQALQKAALYYLDLIECAFLSGIGEQRYEEYRDYLSEEGEWVKDFFYRDVYDETLTEFSAAYDLLEDVTLHFYADGTPKEALGYISTLIEDAKAKDKETPFETLNGGKFSYLLEEGTQC